MGGVRSEQIWDSWDSFSIGWKRLKDGQIFEVSFSSKLWKANWENPGRRYSICFYIHLGPQNKHVNSVSLCARAGTRSRPTVGKSMDCGPPAVTANEGVALLEDGSLPLTLHNGTTLQLKKFLSLKELAHSDTAWGTWICFMLWLLHSWEIQVWDGLTCLRFHC